MCLVIVQKKTWSRKEASIQQFGVAGTEANASGYNLSSWARATNTVLTCSCVFFHLFGCLAVPHNRLLLELLDQNRTLPAVKLGLKRGWRGARRKVACISYRHMSSIWGGNARITSSPLLSHLSLIMLLALAEELKSQHSSAQLSVPVEMERSDRSGKWESPSWLPLVVMLP